MIAIHPISKLYSFIEKVRNIFSLTVKEDVNEGEKMLSFVHQERGLLWERIASFNDKLQQVNGAVVHHTQEMEDLCPLKHHIEDGLYTREIFMPKGALIISFIHLQNHPSFFMSGEMSVLLDTGEVKRIKAPMKVMTEIGTQRVGYMHEDCVWVCVYKTSKTTVEEAEKQVYTLNYKDLPENIINKNRLICQE